MHRSKYKERPVPATAVVVLDEIWVGRWPAPVVFPFMRARMKGMSPNTDSSPPKPGDLPLDDPWFELLCCLFESPVSNFLCRSSKSPGTSSMKSS